MNNDIPIIEEDGTGEYTVVYKDHQDHVIKKEYHKKEMSFLPKNYEAPKSSGNYLRLTEGSHRFRVLDDAVVGYEYFTKDNKPVRSKEPFEEKPSDIADGRDVKEFWAFPVWNVDEKKIQILELTQKKIKDIILALTMEEEYGDPQNYDLVITREGKGFSDTKYTVLPKPPSPITTEIKNAYEKSNIKIENLFKGENPFPKE
jgi:hypothetical protein